MKTSKRRSTPLDGCCSTFVRGGMWPASLANPFFLRYSKLTVVEIYLEILNAKEAFHDFDSLRRTGSLYHEKELLTY